MTSIVLASALLSNTPSGWGASSTSAASDEVLLEMSQAFQKGQTSKLSELLPRARGHILEPWAAYWELRARLESASEAEITGFLKRYQGTYQEDRLRNDWLLLLGQNRQWSRFLVEAPNFRMQDDPQVRCYTLAMEQELAHVDMSQEVGTLWARQKDSDDACAYAAQVHYSKHLLSDQDIWQKVRLSVERSRTRAAHQALALVAPQASAQLDKVLAKPRVFLEKTAVTDQALTREMAVLALIKLAKSDTDLAAKLLSESWSNVLEKSQRDWVWGSIGSESAKNLSDQALDYFAKVKPRDLNDAHLVWYARSALRQGQWPRVLAAIAAMSAPRAAEPTWVYWRARGLLAISPNEAAREQARLLLQSIAGIRGFYEMLALEELGQSILPPPMPEPLSPAEKSAAQDNPGLQRALAAIQLGLRSEGVREWNYSTNLHAQGGMGERELLAAADLACQAEVWDRCINTSERTKQQIDITQRYPMPHKQAVLARSQAIGLDPAYVYGLIRQESRFIVNAHSGVGASGLMQVMPATARWTAKKIGLSGFRAQQLTERDTNIAIGTGYLKLVLDDFQGSMPMAAAAYNAGPGRPRSWRGQGDAPVLEAAIWTENIPFDETRDYVKKVLSNTTIYAAMLRGTTQSLKARMGEIGPRETNTSANIDLP